MVSPVWNKRLVIQVANEEEYLLLMAWYEIELEWRWKDSTLATDKRNGFEWHQQKIGEPVSVEYKNYFYVVHWPNIDCIIMPFKLFAEINDLHTWKDKIYDFPGVTPLSYGYLVGAWSDN